MGIRKQLFGVENNCKGTVPESSASQTMHTTNLAVSDGRTGQGHDGLRAGFSEAGASSCTPDRNKYVVPGISEAGTSSSQGMFSPMATVTASENATPDDEKKYTHKEDIDPALIPRPGMSFRDRDEARAFYAAYAEKESGTTCRVEASHVLECNKDNGKKRAVSATSKEVSQHGQDVTTLISLVPPEKAKPKGRNKTEADKAAITLGASGEKLGTRRCKACGQYATHNARTCLSLEHNRVRLEAMRNKKRGRPPGAKNEKVSWKEVNDGDEEDNRVKTRQKVVAENTYNYRGSDNEGENEEEAGSE